MSALSETVVMVLTPEIAESVLKIQATAAVSSLERKTPEFSLIEKALQI